MELLQTILERRSTRKYSPTPVPQELLQDLLEKSCWAPSGLNRQPWYFTVVQSPENLALLKTIMAEASRREKANLEKTFAKHPDVVRDTRTFLETLGGAPVCMLVFLAKDYGDATLTMLESTAASIQTFLLLAHEQGLSTCWITGHLSVEEKIQSTFGQCRGKCVAMVTVGYGTPPPKAPKRHFNNFEFV